MCANSSNATEERELLPTNVTPVHYDLFLAPDLDAFTYTGHVSIKVRINDSTDKIVLHSNDLEIEEAVISSTAFQPEESLTASAITLEKEDETAHLAFAQSLPSG
ncbi:Aminopeptidase 2 mitochondrial, partial [Dipsacomyces acuminosporus]